MRTCTHLHLRIRVYRQYTCILYTAYTTLPQHLTYSDILAHMNTAAHPQYVHACTFDFMSPCMHTCTYAHVHSSKCAQHDSCLEGDETRSVSCRIRKPRPQQDGARELRFMPDDRFEYLVAEHKPKSVVPRAEASAPCGSPRCSFPSQGSGA